VKGAVLDSGALIAFHRNDRRVVAIVARAVEHGDSLVVPAGVVAQVWRDGRKQARLARLLGSPVCEVAPLDDAFARSVGQVIGMTRVHDVVDISVALTARSRRMNLVTSDPDDMRRIDARLSIVAI
jgi:predicted nucleic acid-binding protein